MAKKILFSVKIVLCVISAIALLYLLLVAEYALISPDEVEENVIAGASEFNSEGTYPTIYAGGGYLDNFTDAACITGTYIRKDAINPFMQALNSYQVISDSNPVIGLYNYFNNTSADTIVRNHGYMWDGYRVWLMPLLVRFNVKDIRYILFVANMAMFFAVIFLLYRKVGMARTIPFIIGYNFFNFIGLSSSFLYFQDYNVFLLASLLIIITTNQNKEKYVAYIIALSAAFVGFFSMLITPLLTIGFPLIVWLIVHENEGIKLSYKIKKIISYSVIWVVSYAITVGSKIFISRKWVLDVDGGENSVINYIGKQNFRERIEAAKELVTRAMEQSRSATNLFEIFFIISIIYIIINYRHIAFGSIKKYIPYLILGLYPFSWPLIVCQHTQHGWSPWLMSISVFAISYILLDCCKKIHDNKMISNKKFNANDK